MRRSIGIAVLAAALALGTTARAAEPPPLAVTNPSCVLKGTNALARGVELYDAAKGGRLIAVFSGVLTPLTVSAIPLTDREARARLSTSTGGGAFRIDGYVVPATIPLYTSRDLPVAPGHLWIAAHQNVLFKGADADRLRVEHLVLGTREQLIAASGPCDAFSLAPSARLPEDDHTGARGYRSRATTLPLHARPGGPSALQTLILRDGATRLFWSREARGGYRHVLGRADLVIDAWVPQRMLEPMRPGELMDPYVPAAPVGAQLGLNEPLTLQTAKRDIPIRARHEPEEPIIGVIETGAEFYFFANIEGWASVLPKSLAFKPPPTGGFWVPETDVMP